MFKTAKTHRISHNIVQQIRKAILRGDLRPGDRLPPEKELADRFEVSKASLREAIRSLEALGLLEVRQGVAGGAFICEVDRDTVRNALFNYIFFQNPPLHEFSKLRLLLEPPMAAEAALRITDQDLADLQLNLQQTADRPPDSPFYFELDNAFHHRIAAIGGSFLICFIVDALKTMLMNVKLQLELDAAFSAMVFHSHVRIVEALARRDPEAARREMAENIETVAVQMVSRCDSSAPFEP